MTKLEQAARQALDALEKAPYPVFHKDIVNQKQAITALREALAEQEANEWYEKLLWDKRDGIDPSTDYQETYDQGGSA